MDGEKPTQPDSPWKFTNDAKTASPTSDVAAPEVATEAADDTDDKAVTWTASEFVAHHKTFVWYLTLGFVTIALALLVHRVTHDVISTGVVAFVGLILGLAAGRKPQVLSYRIDQDGVAIGEKKYPYANFKSFFLVREGAFTSITLMPTGRFMPDLSIYYDPADELKILSTLGDHLPMEQGRMDVIDRLMHWIRF